MRFPLCAPRPWRNAPAALLALLLLTLSTPLSAQDSDDDYVSPSARPDTARTGWTVRPGEKFDLVFHTGYLLGTGSLPDSVPANALSGSIFVGLSFNWVLNSRIALKVQPGVAFYKLNFSQSSAKTFPTRDSTYTTEKLRAFYIEVPVGVAFALSRDEGARLRAWAEVGASVGYRFETSLKVAGTDANGASYKLRTDDIAGFARWRVGLYGKLMYKFIGLHGYYRLTDVFEPGAGYDPAQGVRRSGSARFPEPPRFELGISIAL